LLSGLKTYLKSSTLSQFLSKGDIEAAGAELTGMDRRGLKTPSFG